VLEIQELLENSTGGTVVPNDSARRVMKREPDCYSRFVRESVLENPPDATPQEFGAAMTLTQTEAFHELKVIFARDHATNFRDASDR
jgi:hypothetical protein